MKCFKNTNIYVEGKGIINTSLCFDEYIRAIGEIEECEEIKIPSSFTVVPGFIDEHIHGANSFDTMDSSFEAIDGMAKALLKEGTTSFCPTTMTQSLDNIKASLNNINNYIINNNKNGARVIGIHLEGPFISSKYKGAQKDEFIVKPSVELFKNLNIESGNNIKIVTIAVEEDKDHLVKYLHDNNIIASVGHSNAKESDVINAIENGLKSVTHTYNAMSPLHHREIGVVGSALYNDKLNCELIADTIHVSIPAMKLLIKNKPKDKITLITDAIRAKGLDDGESELGGQKVIVKNGEARLEDGTLAGSVLKMNESVKNIITKCSVNYTDAIDMATINPAKNLGLDKEIGSIKVGKKADFTVLDENFNVIITIRDGIILYK